MNSQFRLGSAVSTTYSELASFTSHAQKSQRIWHDTLLIPILVATSSLLLLSVHWLFILLRRALKRPVEQPSTPTPALYAGAGAVTELRARVHQTGGVEIFTWRLIRFLGALALLGLSVTTLVQEQSHDGHLNDFNENSRLWKIGGTEALHKHDSVNISFIVTYAYTSILALCVLVSNARQARYVSIHLGTVLLASWTVFFYRDVWPLGTFNGIPLDIPLDKLFWPKFFILTVIGVVTPLLIPKPYIPVDPNNPSDEPAPEQTASLLSFLLFSFLDSLVWAGYRTRHLAYEGLPPLADYDRASWLKQRAFAHLDPFLTGKKRHVLWGLMFVFRKEFGVLTISLVVRTVTSFFAPIGVNRLLSHIESGGVDATVRPWVWIILIVIGPVIGSIALQVYIFISTRMLVRVESILTELVFEHSLRIRMKEETSESIALPPTPSETATAVDSDEDVDSSSGGTAAAQSKPPTTATKPGVKGKEPLLPSRSVSRASTATPAPKKDDSKQSNLIGKINNLATSDLSNITEGRDFLFLVFYCPLNITLCILFLYRVLGWSAFVGLASMILTFPVTGWIAKRLNTVSKERMKKTDARVQQVTEITGLLRMVKLFGWEAKISERLREKREDELVWIRQGRLWTLANNTVTYWTPLLTMVLTYATFTVIMGRPLSASIVFSSMAIFEQLRDVLHIAYTFLPPLIQAKVSLERLTSFLNDTELLDRFTQFKDSQVNIPPPETAPETIGFNDATFRWATAPPASGTSTPGSSSGSASGSRNFRLRIDGPLTFKRDAVNLIVGPTGSGKTSLLLALIGELHFEPEHSGSWYQLPREGGVAYAAQEAWVQNETIRDNIVFGAPFDEERYNKVLHQCALERDLSLFDARDKTEVGEKGLTLSGGQKARITLARAIYSRAEVLLLDDVLSALDVHTSKWIVDKCFRGDLVKGRTIILVTHNVGLVSDLAQFVVSLSIDGRIVSRGSIVDALMRDRKLLAEVEKVKAENAVEEQIIDQPNPDDTVVTEPTEVARAKKADGKLIVAEEIAVGHVSWSALGLYFHALGGLIFWVVFLGGFFGASVLTILQTYCLGYWARQYEGVEDPRDVPVYKFIGIYGVLLGSCAIVYSIAFVVFFFGAVRASRSIHSRLIDSILGTTLRWLDTVPTSRIIARATGDLRSVDGPLPEFFLNFVRLGTSLICRFTTIIYLSPVFVFPGIALASIGWWLGQVYIASQMSVKREMSNTRAPVLGHFNASISGLASIRAYGAEAAFKQESMKRIDKYTRAARPFHNLTRWVSIRIDTLSGLFVGSLATYLIYGPGVPDAARTGFLLVTAVTLSNFILWIVRIHNLLEVEGNSVERIQQYLTIEQEPKPTADGTPPAYWPTSGELRVENLDAKYSEDGPLVLEKVNFTLKSGERVGVVGRTGSGKSSLTLSLLRGIFTSGYVSYDGIDIGKLNLDALRGNITIIPQQPELLSGTLRQNLDPFEQHDDAYLNDSLRSSGLFKLQEQSDEDRITLDTPISSGGGNLSLGQRQIIALARAIARRSKILILDEATAAVDYETDNVIQESIRRELQDVTLITVAHRLHTVMDADKIMVLDAGRLVEFDTPKELLKKTNGLLRSLVEESVDKEQLIAMAEGQGRSS